MSRSRIIAGYWYRFYFCLDYFHVLTTTFGGRLGSLLWSSKVSVHNPFRLLIVDDELCHRYLLLYGYMESDWLVAEQGTRTTDNDAACKT